MLLEHGSLSLFHESLEIMLTNLYNEDHPNFDKNMYHV